MASVSYNYYVGNGVKKDYEFTQELNTQATVYGLVNQVETSGTWDSGTGFFTFDVAPASGAEIYIARRTSNDTAVATFPNKSYIDHVNLDGNVDQSLHQVQELQFDTVQVGLLNAGAPGYAAAAAASAAAALVSENAAELAETNAETAETNAETAETNAAASAAAALVSENNAAATLANAVTKDGLTPMDSAADLTFSGGGEVLGLPATPSATGAASKEYADTKVPLAGGTMTGQLTLNYPASPLIALLPTTGSGLPQYQLYDSNSVLRGSMLLAEPTGEVIVRRNNSSGVPVTDFGLSTDGNVTVSGTAPTASNHLTRKDYVESLHRNPNVIINGNMDIWQRGAGPWALTTGLESYGADRFYASFVGAAGINMQKQAAAPASATLSTYSMRLDVTTADTFMDASDLGVMGYRVEGYDIAPLVGGNATLSFWVYATKTGIYCVSFANSARNRCYVAEYTINTTLTWQKVEITVPMTETGGTWDYINGIGLDIAWCVASGSTYHGTADTWNTSSKYATSNQVNALDNVANDFYLAQVKLEAGSLATEMPVINYVDEFAKCQRYCQVYSGAPFRAVSNGSTTAGRAGFTLPVVMRATPTGSMTGTGTFYDGTATYTYTAVGTSYCSAHTAEFDTTISGSPTAGKMLISYQGGGGILTLSSEL